MESHESQSYGALWKIWGVLLVLTAIMVFVDAMGLPRVLLLVILIAAMLTKAFFISSQFMDLKHEKLAVGISVAFSILFFGALLFALIAPDGIAVLHGGR
ncbi:MAG TPA: cytochrome C oxidase subunit IV family protein [Vicinamibacteria bacterium]|jgi:cytochrome c oxidase subunit IV|nr:cytochrome C oxidase subunit IV family protein [Vicinamibacteria bacterium]